MAERFHGKRNLLKPSLNWLLLLVPVAIALRYWPAIANPTALFICSAIAIIPVAGWIGRATEELAARVGEGLGGLLNATFGNAAELIIAGIALSKGLTGVVKASITGSIIGNILLVLGASILAGGMRFPRQTFNQTAARISATSLSLAAIGLIIPTIFHQAADRQPGGWSPQAEQNLSMAIAAVLFLTYILWLVFMLITHKELFTGQGFGKDGRRRKRGPDLVRFEGDHDSGRGDDTGRIHERVSRRFSRGSARKPRADGSVRRRHHRSDYRQCG